MSYFPSPDALATNLQNVSLDAKPKKKRAARAFHTDMNPPVPVVDARVFSPSLSHNAFQANPQNAMLSSLGTSSMFQANPSTNANAMLQPQGNSFNLMLQGNSQSIDPAPGFAAGSAGSVFSTIPELGHQQSQPYEPELTLSIPDQRRAAQQEYASTTFNSFRNIVPPVAGTQFTAVDENSAAPRHARLSLYCVPATEKVREAARLPLGVVLRPFARTAHGDAPVPVVDLRDIGGPPRCNRCRTYINPMMQHTADYKFVCNVCQFASPQPQGYSAALDASGIRVDYYQRPELSRGVVDFLVPDAYNADPETPPQPLHHVFLIDVSQESVARGMPELAAEAIRATLYDMDSGACQLPEGTRVAIITFDQKIHFYNLSESLTTPAVAVMADLEDPFLPFFGGLFADARASSAIIDATLVAIENARSRYTVPEPAFGAALTCATHALAQVGGGKITALLAARATWGPGKLRLKTDQGTDTFTPESSYFKDLTATMLKSNVGVDLIVAATASVDLINPGTLVARTGGQTRLYQNLHSTRDARAFVADFQRGVLGTRGYQAQLKVRCSNGLQVKRYYVFNGDKDAGTDPMIPIVHLDQTISVLFTYDGKLDAKTDAHFQAAMLYTSARGERRVRVINMVASVSERVNDVFAFADQDTVLALLVRDNLTTIPPNTVAQLRELTNTKLVNIYAQYRALLTQSVSSSSQFIFPESLKTLAAYVLAFQKSRALRDGTNGDARIAQMLEFNFMPLATVTLRLYPQIYAVHDLAAGECARGEPFMVPQPVRASSAHIAYGGCYLAFDGDRALLWIHDQVNPLLLQDLFGPTVQAIGDIDPLMDEVPDAGTEISAQVRALVAHFAVRAGRSFQAVQVARVGIDAAEHDFRAMLVEDATHDKLMAYGEYLGHLHRAIKTKLDSETKGDQDVGFLGQRFGVH
ncbi:hypothetical protein BABINDRAFT_161114 [Babjeviella inositovora NRRL Y-12698]|uniref:VWFA domain-containing protein n=1 Tax=Babjeviella inositovora NRRL Y-12698 TaxID=984486 RepID=A0A1E3QT76_9ASCO|nr:uncharacterized protein BABINDRAFT_161114 [Babjeviella inositovora NRRL Y-12698]ODQ80127.1 hypothetical protein BABINDRAFT_161114 [Babjeviella inositovora NRRL Y-12698]